MEIGQISIGGKLDSGNIEQGLNRVETGFKNVGATGKSVNSDFVRMNQQAVRLGKTMGLLSLAGAGAMIAMAKGAPAVAGSMARIRVSLLRLKFAIGEALAPAFERVSGWLERFVSWGEENPNIFNPLVNAITTFGIASGAVAVGGWIMKIWVNFFKYMKKIFTWGGWVGIGTVFKTVWSTIKNVGIKIGKVITTIVSAMNGLWKVISNFLVGGAGGGIVQSVMGVGATAGGMMLGPLINTYQRGFDGEGQGWLDKQFAAWSAYKQKTMSKQEMERQWEYAM